MQPEAGIGSPGGREAGVALRAPVEIGEAPTTPSRRSDHADVAAR